MKDNPRNARLSLRFNDAVKSLAMKRCRANRESMADYVERLVLADLKVSAVPHQK